MFESLQPQGGRDGASSPRVPQRASPASTSNPTAAAVALGSRILRLSFAGLETTLPVRLWNGTLLYVGGAASGRTAQFTLVFNTPAVIADLVLGSDPLRLAEAYFRGEVDIEGDLFAALAMKDQLLAHPQGWRGRLSCLLDAVQLRAISGSGAPADVTVRGRRSPPVRMHSRVENRRSIGFHYDVSNDFYALWLDRRMVYSCAYFQHAAQSLDDAQESKLELICRKLLLKPGERFLDIGCGWGGLVIHAARHHGVRARGITLSGAQCELARKRIAEAGLEDRVSVDLLDYRDLDGSVKYDKVASVGMFEHVGLKNFGAYFGAVQRVLESGGLFLNHGITHDQEGWQRNLSTEFINRYVFPDGQLESIGNVQRAMERARFEILDVESLRLHYALTLRHWVRRLEQSRERARSWVAEEVYRIWRLYMAAAALEFDRGGIGVYQVLARQRAPGRAPLPLTREHLCAPRGEKPS